MKKLLFFAVALTFYTARLAAQGCTVDGSATLDTIVCGQSVLLSAFGQGQGVAVLSENFNNGAFGPGWSATTQAMWNNPCSPNGVDGTTHIWLGNSSPVPRALTTAAFNLSNCANAGVTICFDMLFAEQGNSAPCEGPDEPDEGVYLQYSTDNGATWNTIHYFDPNGGSDPQFINWNNWCFQVPPAALINGVKFRWFQDNDSGADYDHWGIDNVVIYCNDPSYNIVWQHDNYNLGPTGGTDPNPVTPTTTTTYTVVMTNGTVTCTDQVTIVVRNPTIIVNAGADTSVCSGTCAQLNATAKVLVSPAKVITYSNNELTQIATGFGQVSNIGINVTGLNMTNVLPNSITQICVNNIFFFGFGGFPPAQVDIGDLILSVTCPSGQTITLVPANVTTGGSNPLTGGYSNTCFVPVGGTNIASGTAPYSGSFAPNQPFNNLAGCTGNGVWTFNVQMNSTFGFGSGTFSGWSITFDDPEISYQGNFSWSPTTNMTGSNTLTPTVCPPPTAFTLTVSDTAGCVSQSDVVNVTTHSCCQFGISAAVTQPACAQNNGSISLTVSPAGNYTYTWNDGNTNATRNNLAAGVYHVTVHDVTNNCSNDTVITLNSNSTLALDSSNVVNPTCGLNNGAISLTLSGGTAPYTLSVDTGSGTVNVPVTGTTATLPNLPAETYSFVVTDNAGCQATLQITLTGGGNCCNLAIAATLTQPGCGQTTGSAAINVTSAGTAPYSYSLDGGNFGSGSSFASLNPGSHTVIAQDAGGCRDTVTFTIQNGNAGLSATVNTVAASCNGIADGQATAVPNNGTAPYNYAWSTGGSTATVTNLPAGPVTVTVTDANQCSGTATGTVSEANPLTVDLGVDLEGCEGTLVSITAPAGYTDYLWSNGSTSQGISTQVGGQFSIIVHNAAGCTAYDTVQVTIYPNPGVSLGADVTAYEGTEVNLSVAVTGNTGGTYNWQPDTLLSCNNCPNPVAQARDTIQYIVFYVDAHGCPASDSIVIYVLPVTQIVWPNAFTPNGDGRNDVFGPVGSSIKTISLKIIDRWGAVVFENNGTNLPWDGTFKGQAQPSGTYLYVGEVTLLNDEKHTFKGSFALLR